MWGHARSAALFGPAWSSGPPSHSPSPIPGFPARPCRSAPAQLSSSWVSTGFFFKDMLTLLRRKSGNEEKFCTKGNAFFCVEVALSAAPRRTERCAQHLVELQLNFWTTSGGSFGFFHTTFSMCCSMHKVHATRFGCCWGCNLTEVA